MIFGITARPDLDASLELARTIAEHLAGRGIDVVLDKELCLDGPGAEQQAPLGEMDVDILITIGGDGTILRSAQMLDVPIFSINMGLLGFLTEIPPEMWESSIDRIINGDYTVDSRVKLSTWVNGEQKPDAVNEAVIHTTQISKMRHFKVLVDSHEALNIRSDGLIISTPTGSTCYAMSVGSPIVDPKADVIIIVPIAPFKLSARPLVVSGGSEIEVILLENKDALLVLDGQMDEEVGPGSTLSFKLSGSNAQLIRFDVDFYSRFNKKIAKLMMTGEL